MATSIYYTAKIIGTIEKGLKEQIEKIVYRKNFFIKIKIEKGDPAMWETFSYDIKENQNGAEKVSIFSGSTNLPSGSNDAAWVGIQHWVSCLTEIRQLLNKAEWKVSVDAHELVWDEEKKTYDLNK